MLRTLFILWLALATQVQASGDFVGGESCTSCHAQQHALWQGSHHDLAMTTPTPDTVLGDFDQATFTHRDVTTTFFREGDQWLIRTAGEDGKLTDFPVRYTFGIYPLQQYLLPLSRGRLQAFAIAWDSRPEAEGGQRWFHLNPDEVTDHTDPLHWTGPYMNWNTRCAECHSTNVEKRYDAATRSFDTRFSTVDVSCEACHGPGEAHLKLVENGGVAEVAGAGFPLALGQRGDWAFNDGAAIASRLEPLQGNTQIDSCGRCHSRRGTLGEYHYGKPLLDTIDWRCRKARSTTTTGRYATKSLCMAHGCRATCIRPGWSAATATSLTACSCGPPATGCARSVTRPRSTTSRSTTITRRPPAVRHAPTATCRKPPTWWWTRVATTACEFRGRI